MHSIPSERSFPAWEDHEEVKGPRTGYWRPQPGLHSPLQILWDNSKILSIQASSCLFVLFFFFPRAVWIYFQLCPIWKSLLNVKTPYQLLEPGHNMWVWIYIIQNVLLILPVFSFHSLEGKRTRLCLQIVLRWDFKLCVFSSVPPKIVSH